MSVTSTAPCPVFVAHAFKKNKCRECGFEQHDHAGASSGPSAPKSVQTHIPKPIGSLVRPPPIPELSSGSNRPSEHSVQKRDRSWSSAALLPPGGQLVFPPAAAVSHARGQPSQSQAATPGAEDEEDKNPGGSPMGRLIPGQGPPPVPPQRLPHPPGGDFSGVAEAAEDDDDDDEVKHEERVRRMSELIEREGPPLPSAKGRPPLPHPSHNVQPGFDGNHKKVKSMGGSRVVESDFASKLIHKWTHVMEQVKSGLYTLKRVRGFFKRFHALQIEYSKALTKIVLEERQKLETHAKPGQAEPDRMATTYRSYVGFLEGMQSIADLHRGYASEVTTDVFEPLDQFHVIGSARVKEVTKILDKSNKELVDLEKTLQKKRTTANSLLDDLNEKSRKLKEMDPIDIAGEKAKEKLNKQVEKMREKCLTECVKYDIAQRTGHQQREAHYFRVLPTCLNDMQAIEEFRLQNMKLHLQRFIDMQLQFQTSMRGYSEGLTKEITDLRADADIEYFINHCTSVHGEPPKLKAYEYDLSVPIASLRPGYVNPHAAVFGSTIKEIMTSQERMEPATDYGGVPRILQALTKALKDQGGLNTEGIFRVSASHSEVEQLRDRVSHGDYSMSDVSSPHVAAALLKFWLRDLREPLIPSLLYAKAIAVGQSILQPPNSNRAGDDDEKSEHVSLLSGSQRSHSGDHGVSEFMKERDQVMDQLESILKDIPPENRRVMDFVLNLIRDVADNQAVNRMGISNLAIVFAPSFLRSPGNNPMTMFKDSKAAAQMVVHLAELSEVPEPGTQMRVLDILGEQAAKPRQVNVSGIPIISLEEARRRQNQAPSPPVVPSPSARSAVLPPRPANPQVLPAHKYSASVSVGASAAAAAADPFFSQPIRGRQRSQTEAHNNVPRPVNRRAPPVPALPSDWVQYYTEDGIPYYLNTKTSHSQWEFPKH